MKKTKTLMKVYWLVFDVEIIQYERINLENTTKVIEQVDPTLFSTREQAENYGDTTTKIQPFTGRITGFSTKGADKWV